MATPRDIWIDTDPGKDDAIAILAALGSPELNVVGISTVGGNVNAGQTATNALKILEFAGRPDIPVHAGESRPLARAPIFATHVHGEDGLGGMPLPEPRIALQPEDGVSALISRLRRSQTPVHLCCLGPLTNIAKALETAPDITDKIGGITLMGGAFGDPPGNIRAHAEFNFFVDPEAAAKVFATPGIAITMMPLDLTHQCVPTAERRAAIGRCHAEIGPVLQQALDTKVGEFSPGVTQPLHDPTVFAYVARPEMFQSMETTAVEVAHGDSEVAGQSQLVATDPAARATVTVAWAIDSDRFYQFLNDRIGTLKGPGSALAPDETPAVRRVARPAGIDP